MIKSNWYATSISDAERIAKCEAVGDTFTALTKQSDETVFIIMEHMAFAELAGKIMSFGGELNNILRTREKSLYAAAKLTEKAKQDDVLKEALTRTYRCTDLLKWSIDWLKTSEHSSIAKLREYPEFIEMLNKNFYSE